MPAALPLPVAGTLTERSAGLSNVVVLASMAESRSGLDTPCTVPYAGSAARASPGMREMPAAKMVADATSRG